MRSILSFSSSLALLFFTITISLAQYNTRVPGGKTEPTNNSGNTPTTAYGVVVGISNYEHLPDLLFADRDARVFADYLIRSAGVPASQVEILVNQKATLINLTDALTTVKINVNPGDRVYVYFAGHGDIETLNDSTENAMLMLYGASRKDYNATFDKCYLREMKRWLDELTKAGAEVVFVADACRSGAFVLMGGSVGQSRTMLGLGKEWAGQVKILSCEPGELAIEGVEFGNGRGLFSYCLVDGLMGMADSDKDSVITKSELEVYLKTTVPKTARPHIQHPEVLGGEGELPLGTFNPDSLRTYQQHKTRNYSLLTATQTKGFEADLLQGHDSTTRRVYGLFEQALTARHLLYPAGQSALAYLRQIPARNNAKLLGLMKRNLVAALQIRTEGLLRPLLQEIREYEPPTPVSQVDSAIAEMDTSIILQGKGHNLVQNITARRLFLEGKRLLTNKQERAEYNDSLSLIAMTRFRESVRLEPNMPYTYWEMSKASSLLLQVDSAMVHLEKCRQLLPNSPAILNRIGFQYQIRHQSQKSRIYFEKALQLDPTDPVAHSNLADFFHTLGNNKQVEFHRQKAVDSYEKLYAGKAELDLLLGRKAALYYDIGQYDIAIGYLRDLLKIDSTDAEAYTALSYCFSKQEKWDDCIVTVERAIQLNPTISEAQSLRALVYCKRYEKNAQRADLLQAGESAEKSLRLNPQNYAGLLARSIVEFHEANYSVAKAFAQKAIQSNPSMGEPYYFMGLIGIMLKDTTQARLSLTCADSLNFPEAPVQLAFGLLNEVRKDYVSAEKAYRKADSLNPNNPANLAGLTRSLLLQKKNLPEVLSLCERLQKLTPVDEGVWTIPGSIYFEQKKYSQALSAFSEAFRLNPRKAKTLKMIDEISTLTQQYKPAAEAYRRASDLDSTNVLYAYTAAKLFYIDRFNVKRPDDAFLMASRVVAIDTIAHSTVHKRDSIVNARLAMCYAILGNVSTDRKQYQQSIHWYEKVLLAEPESSYTSRYQYQIGYAYNLMNQAPRGIPYFKEAIRLKPDNVDYHTMLAIALVRSGDNVAAESEARTVLRLDSTSGRNVQTLTVALMRQGRYAEAWEAGKKLEKLAPPGSWEIFYFYARWYARQSKTKEALPQLEKAFKQGLDVNTVLANPDFDPIRQDADFMNLIRTHSSDKK